MSSRGIGTCRSPSGVLTITASDAPRGITTAKALFWSVARKSPTRTAVTRSATTPVTTKRLLLGRPFAPPQPEVHCTMAPSSVRVDRWPVQAPPPCGSMNRTDNSSSAPLPMNTRRSSSTNARRTDDRSTRSSNSRETMGGKSPSDTGRSRTETRSARPIRFPHGVILPPSPSSAHPPRSADLACEVDVGFPGRPTPGPAGGSGERVSGHPADPR